MSDELIERVALAIRRRAEAAELSFEDEAKAAIAEVRAYDTEACIHKLNLVEQAKLSEAIETIKHLGYNIADRHIRVVNNLGYLESRVDRDKAIIYLAPSLFLRPQADITRVLLLRYFEMTLQLYSTTTSMENHLLDEIIKYGMSL